MGWNKARTIFTVDGEGAYTGKGESPYMSEEERILKEKQKKLKETQKKKS